MKVCSLSNQRVGRSLISQKDLLKQRYLLAKAGYPLRRSQSLPTTLLSPVRIVSSVNVTVVPWKRDQMQPTILHLQAYTGGGTETRKEVIEHDGQSSVKSTIFISPTSGKKDTAAPSEVTRLEGAIRGGPRPCAVCSVRLLPSLSTPSGRRPLCEHMRL